MNIKRLRVSKNLTQEELASKLKINRTTVAMWESGESLPRAKTLIELARIFDCTVDEILREEKEAV